MNIALTGITGRLGTCVVRVLLAAGHRIIGLDRRVPEGDLSDGVTFVQDDLMDTASLRKQFAGCDGVIHLAAIPNPRNDPPERVFANNVVTSYNVLLAAVDAGVKKVCVASSINAIGGAFSRKARYEYFPVDEQHPTYNEDAYSLSKWVLEAQADSIARLHGDVTISSLRFHGLVKRNERTDMALPDVPEAMRSAVPNHLWGYTDIESAAQACLLAMQATFDGHEAFFIVSPRTIFHAAITSNNLATTCYPAVPLRAALSANAGFYNCDKARRLLGWTHSDSAP